MFVQKLLKQNRQVGHNQTARYVPWLIVAIFVATIGLRLHAWINDGSNTPLLSPDDAMIQFSNVNEIPTHTKTSVALPTETFGAMPYVIGVYQTDSKLFPANSVAIVFVKDNARSFEMDVVPNGTLVQAEKRYPTFKHEDAVIEKNSQGEFIRLRDDDVPCKHPRNISHPSFCPFKNLLLFEHNESLIMLFGDGDNQTDGELLLIARSIK